MLASLMLVSCSRPGPAPDPAPKAEAVKEKPDVFREINFRALNRRVPVIMYHDIVKERGTDSVYFDCTVDEFKAQLKFIQDQGAVPISLDDLYAHLTEGAEIPDKAIVLTFDDNYQGFYDNALPLLEENRYPFVMFVHTGFVGDTKTSHPKMSWDTLRLLVKNPLATIGGHTVTHPELDTLPERLQRKELTDSKLALEKELGIKVRYLAYPVGKYDETSVRLAKELGYRMSFTIENQLAEESPGILTVGRYIHTRIEKAWEDRTLAFESAPAAASITPIQDAPVEYKELKVDRIRLALVYGGVPVSLNSSTRKGVLDFVKETNAVAGINGGFFDMASIAGKDNKMIGPFKSSDLPILIPDGFPFRWPKLRNRPVVIWGPTQFAIVPFQPEIMNSDQNFKDFMPDYTDVFLGGVWLIRGGVAQTRSQQNVFGPSDIQDARKRAFLGITSDGRFVIGATLNSASSSKLAKALEEAEVSDAVLLDSGFSTSLVYDGEIKAFGHSTATTPSRPVPHAIVIKGILAGSEPTPTTPTEKP